MRLDEATNSNKDVHIISQVCSLVDNIVEDFFSVKALQLAHRQNTCLKFLINL